MLKTIKYHIIAALFPKLTEKAKQQAIRDHKKKMALIKEIKASMRSQ